MLIHGLQYIADGWHSQELLLCSIILSLRPEGLLGFYDTLNLINHTCIQIFILIDFLLAIL